MKTPLITASANDPPFPSLKRGFPKLRFAGITAETVGKTALEIRTPSKFTKAIDFHNFGETVVNQVKIIYGAIILSRIVAASRRSKNEVRETIVRDGSGFAFYLFTVPMLERLLLRMVDKDYGLGLIQLRPKPQTGGISGKLAGLNYMLNPLYRWDIRSSRQVRDQMEQVLARLEKEGHGPASTAYQNTVNEFNKLVIKVNTVKGAGVLLTIGALGIILPLINIAITRKKIIASDKQSPPKPHDVIHRHPLYC